MSLRVFQMWRIPINAVKVASEVRIMITRPRCGSVIIQLRTLRFYGWITTARECRMELLNLAVTILYQPGRRTRSSLPTGTREGAAWLLSSRNDQSVLRNLLDG